MIEGRVVCTILIPIAQWYQKFVREIEGRKQKQIYSKRFSRFDNRIKLKSLLVDVSIEYRKGKW